MPLFASQRILFVKFYSFYSWKTDPRVRWSLSSHPKPVLSLYFSSSSSSPVKHHLLLCSSTVHFSPSLSSFLCVPFVALEIGLESFDFQKEREKWTSGAFEWAFKLIFYSTVRTSVFWMWKFLDIEASMFAIWFHGQREKKWNRVIWVECLNGNKTFASLPHSSSCGHKNQMKLESMKWSSHSRFMELLTLSPFAFCISNLVFDSWSFVRKEMKFKWVDRGREGNLFYLFKRREAQKGFF